MIRTFVPHPNAEVRLFCFPHAGGAASVFLKWSQALPERFEVCAFDPPGRMGDRSEKPLSRLEPLVSRAVDELRPYLDRPFAMLGNSVGALLSFEVTRRLRRDEASSPMHLFLCARKAPHVSLAYEPTINLSDQELIENVRQYYGGIPAVILAEPELLAMSLPMLRADLAVSETYEYSMEPPLTCGFSVFAGRSDISLTRKEVEAWAEHTTGAFDLEMLAGGHMVLENHAEHLQAYIVSRLDQMLGDSFIQS